MEWTTSPGYSSFSFPFSSGSSTSANTNPRRIPPDLRKRAVVSCDRCKKRRRRCVRSRPSAATCELCKEHAVACVTTIPRKRPSVARSLLVNENMPSRHVLIEQLVGRLFPEVAVSDAHELANLADCLEKSRVQIRFVQKEDRMSVTANGATVQCDLASSSTSGPILEGHQASCASQSGRDSFVPTPSELSSIPQETSFPSSTGNGRRGSCCERILQNSSGTLCYFGPSSSMVFVTQLREHLISTAIQNLEKLQPKQRRLRQKFVADNYCCTMEEPAAARSARSYTQRPRDAPQSWPEDVDDNDDDDVSVDAQAFTSPVPDTLQRLVDFLPAREEVEHLVELFFVHIHPNLTLFHRPLFQSELERLWTTSPDRGSQKDVGWLTCCLVVLAFGCKYLASTSSSTDKPVSRGPRDTHTRTRTLLQGRLVEMALGNVARLIQCATLHSVQALALLALYLNTTHQRNASWIMMGCAIRMAISLGMHRSDEILRQKKNVVLSTAVDRELRKRVWWSLYIFEQYNSALFGRPSAIDEQETTSDLSTDSILDEGYHRPPGLITHDIHLARIVDRIRKSQANQGRSVGSLGAAGEPGLLSDDEMAHRHLDELDAWYEDLPIFLRFDASNQQHVYPSHFRQLVTLQLRYQHARLLLTRPFYLHLVRTRTRHRRRGGGELEETDSSVTSTSTRFLGDTCVAAALDSWRLAQHLWGRGLFNNGDVAGLDGVLLYQCGMVLALACLDTRQQQQEQRWDVIVAQGSGGGSSSRGGDRRRVFYHAIEDILTMLRHGMPPDNPMSRMVQIADDFCNIVRSIKSEHGAPVQDPRSDQQLASLPQSPTVQGKSDRMSVVVQENQSRSAETTAAALFPADLNGLTSSSSSWAGYQSGAAAMGPGGQESNIPVVHREDTLSAAASAAAWNLAEEDEEEGTQLIDSMLDWDLSQVFGFEGGGSMSNPFLV